MVATRGAEAGLGRLGAALLRRQALQRAFTSRLAPRREMGGIQPLTAKQPSHLAGLCASVRLLNHPQSVFGGELAAGRLGHHLWVRRPTPRADASASFHLIGSLSALIGSHLNRPSLIPRVAAVSTMLAERAFHSECSRGTLASSLPPAPDETDSM